jgi:hypothetical protein
LIGKGRIEGGGKVKKTILTHQTSLKAQLARIMIRPVPHLSFLLLNIPYIFADIPFFCSINRSTLFSILASASDRPPL